MRKKKIETAVVLWEKKSLPSGVFIISTSQLGIDKNPILKKWFDSFQ